MSRLITILRASQIIIVRAPGQTSRGRPPAYPPTAQRRQRQPGSSRSVASSDNEVQDHGQHDRRDDREHKHPKAPQSATQRLHVVSADSHVRPLPDCGRREPGAVQPSADWGQQAHPTRRTQWATTTTKIKTSHLIVRATTVVSTIRTARTATTTPSARPPARARAPPPAPLPAPLSADPAGVVVGGVVGGVAGGLAGHEAAEKANPEGDEVSGDKLADPGTKRD